jgi:hypothetical protein
MQPDRHMTVMGIMGESWPDSWGRFLRRSFEAVCDVIPFGKAHPPENQIPIARLHRTRSTPEGNDEPLGCGRSHFGRRTRILREETKDPKRAFSGFELYALRRTCLTR